MKLLQNVTNPLTGNKMNTSPSGLFGLFAGALVIWGVVSMSQNAGKWITNKTRGKLDFQPDPIAQKETTVHDNTVYMG